MEINSKMCSKKTHNPIQFLTGFVKLFIILPFLLAGCDGGNDATDQPSSESVSFKLPDSISSKLPAGGSLAATITINDGTPVAMIISGTEATVTLNNIPTGSTKIVITFTYDDNFTNGPLIVASATKPTVDVTTGDNNISFLASDYLTSIHDEDGDGISNLDELDELSTTSPFDTNCVLGIGTLNNCVL